jgi:uncharacterized protein (TIGR03435 family)
MSAALSCVSSVTAQQAKTAFEIASIRPQREAVDPPKIRGAAPRAAPGGVFSATRTNVLSLVRFAYDLKPHQVLGGPDWVRRDMFQIDARAGFDAPAHQIKQMVQSLLEDRFKLVTRWDERTMDYFAVVVARSDGRLGPYLRAVPDDCTAAAVAEARKQFPARPDVGGGGLLYFQCVTLSAALDALSPVAMMESAPPVLDETKLPGKFVMELKASSVIPGVVSEPAADPSLAPFAVALEEQLGLKLQSRRGPVKVLMIDSVQQPTEN